MVVEFDRKALRSIFEGADLEVPPKDVLGKICDLHAATSDGRDDTIKDLQKKLETAEHERDAEKAKGEKTQKAFDEYKAGISAKETKAAKEKAVKAYLEGKKITGDNLDIALMAVSGLVDGLELDGENIKDTSELDGLVSGKLARLVVKTSTRGARTETPPENTGGGKMTKEDIMKIKDTSERQKAIAENIDLFRR